MKARVAIAKCPLYRTEDISAALEKLFFCLGGLKQFVPNGAPVLIKPNLLSDRSPEKAVTTHPEVVRCLIRMVRQCGGIPSVGDSPCGVMKTEALLKITGFRALCDEENVKFVVLEKEPCVTHNYRGIPLAVTKAAFDAGLVINVPKLKTHSFTCLTNAVKNVFGLLPGFQKALLHKSFPTPAMFGNCLAFLYTIVKPRLTVCDAVTAMEGDGPASGDPVNLGFIAASSDGVALDRIVSHKLGFDFKEVPYFAPLRQIGAGETELERIEPAGDANYLDTLRPLRKAGSAGMVHLIPKPLVRLLEPYLWIRPEFKNNCTACLRCVAACPVKALSPAQKKHPFLDRTKCIGCCCCHEACPEEAITMTASPLLRLTSLRNMMRKKRS